MAVVNFVIVPCILLDNVQLSEHYHLNDIGCMWLVAGIGDILYNFEIN